MCWYGTSSTSSNARCATLTLATSPSRINPVSTQEGIAQAPLLQPRAQGGRGERPVARQPAVDRRVQDRERELDVPALRVVGVGQRADRLLRQVAPAALAQQPDPAARDVTREQRLDAVRPLPGVDGDDRLAARVDPDFRHDARVVEPARVRALDRQPQHADRPLRLGRVAREVIRREADAALGGDDPRVPAQLALERQRVQIDQLRGRDARARAGTRPRAAWRRSRRSDPAVVDGSTPKRRRADRDHLRRVG